MHFLLMNTVKLSLKPLKKKQMSVLKTKKAHLETANADSKKIRGLAVGKLSAPWLGVG